ncbi:MAG TPA: efflux RND transporter periplasmic adaptor subunit [Thermoanaerobaculia bacterium]|nr:efflux RND transporter periplasmic adaptor subunit [Thermoanaerobaculia bacterium]
MKKKAIYAAALLVVAAIAAVLVRHVAFAKEATTYRFASIGRGNVESVVSATGTLGAVRTVSVGTQVSGQVADLLVDFNDSVKKGQLLARIDPTLAQQAVTDAQASLERAQAQLLQAQRDHSRNRELLDSGLVARSSFDGSESTYSVAAANVKSARVALDRARQNLAYTNIYAPIDGVVVERNVDSGQTVAASLSAPQLFLIANDLTDMQILVSVGESDIASIREGQKVKFTVAALPRQTFEGTVRQVRLQSATQENVVNYTVVVSVSNPRKQLLPGMTARVSFLVDSAENVLTVPNAALRFKPETAAAEQESPRTRPAQQTRTRRGAGERPAGGRGTLYFLNAKGETEALRVRTGITNGSATEVRGEGVKEGMKVITGTMQPQAAGETGANPFGGQQQPRGPRGGF